MQPEVLKILHVVPSISPRRGGPSVAALSICRALADHGIKADLLTTNDDLHQTLDVRTNEWVSPSENFRILYLPRFSPGSSSVIREFAYSRQLRPLLKSSLRDYDLVHIHALFSYLPSQTMRSCRMLGVPYVLRPLGILENYSLSQSRVRKRLALALGEAANIRGAAAIHWTSSREYEASPAVRQLRHPRQTPQEDWVIPLGVACPRVRVSHSRTGVPQLIFLSRWATKKRIPLLLEALAAISDLEWRCVLAGGTVDQDPHIAQLINQSPIRHRLDLPGFLDGEAKSAALAASNIFVLPSASENFGISVAEAMACGVAPIVSQHVALSEHIRREQLGWVAGDTREAFAAALREAITDPTETERRGQRAAQFAAKQLTWNQCARSLISKYRELSLD